MDAKDQINGWQTLDTPNYKYYRLGSTLFLEVFDSQGVSRVVYVGRL